jgi:lysyl-tRNA synthetase class II
MKYKIESINKDQESRRRKLREMTTSHAPEDASDLGARGGVRAARRANLAALRSSAASIRSRPRATRSRRTPADLLARFAGLTPKTIRRAESFGSPAADGRRKMGKGALGRPVGPHRPHSTLRASGRARREQFALFDALDLGDFVGASGTVFRSKKGDLTLRVRVVRGAGKVARAAAR